MKLILFLFTILLALSTCETAFRPFNESTEASTAIPENPHQDVAQFFEGLFAHFGLGQPKQIIYECFNSGSAALYLESLYGFNQFLIDVINRDPHRVHWDIIKQYILAILEHSTSDCIVATQDLSDLLAALGVKRDPWSGIVNWLYFQAHFAQLFEGYKPVIQGFDSKNFTAAGDAYGALMNETVNVVKNEGLAYLAHTGFANGVSFGLDLALPNDSLAAWNDTTAAYDLEFIILGTKAVADGKWWESFDNLEKFWQEKGEEILGHIPLSVWEAIENSDDNKKLTEKLGVDVMSKEFEDLAVAWIKKHQWRYHAHAKALEKSFEQLDFIHAGILHAHIVEEIAKSK